jgi:hypothetical protein
MSGGNPYAGEVRLELNGTAQRLKLTLGALAELEAALEADSLLALVERFETGTFSSRDLLALLLAGLRGGGWQGSAEDLASAEIAGGPLKAAQVAAELLLRAFAPEEDQPPFPSQSAPNQAAP